jgi:hypothetical protein
LVKGHSYIGGGMIVGPTVDANDADMNGSGSYSSSACGSDGGSVFQSATWCTSASCTFMGGYHAPIPGNGGDTAASNYYFQFRRNGNSLTSKYYGGELEPAPGSNSWAPWVTGGGSIGIPTSDKGKGAGPFICHIML